MDKQQKEVLQSQLNDEKAVLKSLEAMYRDALDEINSKIEILMARQDADMQHVIYQVQYQKALKTQIQAILETLQTNEFETVSEYLTKSYEEGFLGTLYSLQGQGVPLIFPIDQAQVVDAIQTETKLSADLYTAMGHDIKDLQKKIAGEISRGIAGGQMYSEIARNISSWANIPKNNAMRITRTEAHRIQCKAASDAQHKAKSRGADVVKQWDSTLDGRTRDSHRKIDGEIKEIPNNGEKEEPFSNGLMYPGDPNGAAGEVINCRCALLTRARWALDREETKYLGNMDGMSDEDLKPLADKLHMSVDELRTYQGQIVPINAKSYEDFKRQYDKIWRYEGSDLQKEAEARIAGYKSQRVRLGAQKMNGSTSQEQAQNYRPISRSNTVTKQERGKQNISLREIENTTYKGKMYISDSVELKPKQMHNIEKSINDALQIVGEGDKLPICMIISSAEMQTGALCAYNARKNILYIDSVVGDITKLLELQEDMACPDNPLSTYIHELLHWKDADDYRKIAEITKQEEYLSQLREKCKKKLDKLAKEGYNIHEISNYASKTYFDGLYDETWTEYRVLELLLKGGKI